MIFEPMKNRNRRAIFAVVLMLTIMAITSCGSSLPAKEIQKETSPDKLVDAVLVSREAGATVATPIELYLVPHGGDWKKETPVLRGDKFKGLVVEWKRPRFVEIRYAKGRVFAFTSFWSTAQIQQFHYVVELRLTPESESTVEQ